MSDSDLRRIEKLEERLNLAEREITAVAEKQNLIKENLKEEVDRMRIDLREKIDDTKDILKEDVDQIGEEIGTLHECVGKVNSQLQNIYVTQKGANTKISVNEKIVWSIVALIGTGTLYIVQDLIKGAGG